MVARTHYPFLMFYSMALPRYAMALIRICTPTHRSSEATLSSCQPFARAHRPLVESETILTHQAHRVVLLPTAPGRILVLCRHRPRAAPTYRETFLLYIARWARHHFSIVRPKPAVAISSLVRFRKQELVAWIFSPWHLSLWPTKTWSLLQ